MFDDIMKAVRENRRRLHMKWGLLTGEQVTKMLRVEISYAGMPSFRRDVRSRFAGLFYPSDSAHPGPMEVEGVAIYEVPHLPEPYWRIINPLED